MAQQPESGRNASGIARASKRKWGYNPAQVDEFLERTHALYDSGDGQLTQQDIQNVSFDLCKGGYVISQVDAALGRLERAVVDQQTTREITRHGRVVWKAQTEDLYRSLAGHAQRAAKERFRPGEPKSPSYDRKQVDRLIDQVIDKAAAELGVDGVTADDVRDLTDLNSTSVANVIFTQRKGKRGYDERQVDNYLNACVRLLSRLESYARVAEYVHDPATVQSPAPTPVAAPAAALFPPRDARPANDGVSSPTVMDNDLQTMPPSFAPTPQQDSAPAPVAAPTPSVTPTPVATPMPSMTPMSTPGSGGIHATVVRPARGRSRIVGRRAVRSGTAGRLHADGPRTVRGRADALAGCAQRPVDPVDRHGLDAVAGHPRSVVPDL